MWAVVVTEAAELDINAAAVWYEREAVGLGRQFLDAVTATLKRIENNPQQFPLVYGDKRRALLKRFPYGLYFRVEPTVAVVVGCFHGHRNPKAWQSRR
jgi:plasmid stabilization system protein ParE